jgi:FkbM family methyltransferase
VSRKRTLHTYEINGVTLRAYDEEESLAADRVAGELWRDIYGLEAIPFQPGDHVIDIGAHIGLVSMYLAKRWPFLRIHAFEPHPINHGNCAENLRMNDVSKVRLNPQAVTADGRPIVLQWLPSNTGGATAAFDMLGDHDAVLVDSVRLHDILERTLAPGQRCRLLKMDCEGMEYEVLAQTGVLDRVDYLAAEFHEGTREVPGRHEGIFEGAARALAEACAKFFPAERMRIVLCPKTD